LIDFLEIADDDSLFSSELHVANTIVTWTSALESASAAKWKASKAPLPGRQCHAADCQQDQQN